MDWGSLREAAFETVVILAAATIIALSVIGVAVALVALGARLVT